MKQKIQIILGLLFGVGLLWFLFRGTNWPAVYQAIRETNLWLLCLAIIPIWISFITRIQRWSYIVRTGEPVSFRHMFSATQIGFLANFTLPGRVGEVIRALVLSRLTRLPFTKSFAMVTLDRLTDLIGLVVVLCIAALSFSTQGDIVLPAETFQTQDPIVFSAIRIRQATMGTVISLLLIIVLLGFFYAKQSLALRILRRSISIISTKWAERIHRQAEHFTDGLHILSSANQILKSISFSLLTWLCFVVSTFFAFKAFGFVFPWYTPVVMVAMVSVFISVPGAPGFVGQFHIPIVITLMLLVPDMTTDKAKAAAILIHLMNFISVIIVGIYCLFIEHLGLLQLKRESVEIKEKTVE